MSGVESVQMPEQGPEPAQVSVVIIFCNELEFLAEAIDSVFAQTITDWELILVDDGSTDGSSDVAKTFHERNPKSVRYLTHPGHATRGMSSSRNLGVRAARGRYIAYLDGDDRWLPQKLERQLALMSEHPEASLVYGPLTRWYSWTMRPGDQGRDDRYGLHGDGYTLTTGRLFDPPELVALFLRHKDLVPSGALFERQLFLDVGGAEDEFTDSHEDAVVFTKMGLRRSFYCADDSWYLYRQYPAESDRRRRAIGRPDADRLRGDPARLLFLNWCETYIHNQDIRDRRLDTAIAHARRQILQPRRHRLHRFLDRCTRLATRSAGRAFEVGAGR